jgi:hypothetical protein
VAAVAVVGIVAIALLPRLLAMRSTSGESSVATSAEATVPPTTMRWLQANVPVGARLLASTELAPVLRRGLPGREVTEDFWAAAEGDAADFVIVSAGLTELPEDHAARQEARRSRSVAIFGGGALEVRQTATTETEAMAAGRELSRVVPLRLTPGAWSTLVEGDVDARLMRVLGKLAEAHTIDVARFERDAATRRADGPARTAVVTAADGELVSRSGFSVRRLIADLEALPDTLRPAKVRIERRAGKSVLVINYLLPIGTAS